MSLKPEARAEMIRDGEAIASTPCWGERPSITAWSSSAAFTIVHVAAVEAAGGVVELQELEDACTAITLALRIGRAEEMTEKEALGILLGTTPAEAKRLRSWRKQLRAKATS